MTEQTVDIDTPDADDVETAARQMATYSKKAIEIAVSIDQQFISHDRFIANVRAMDRCFQLARTMDMQQGMLLVGPPGSGKTATFKYFRQTLPRSNLFAPGFGAIGIRVGRRPTSGQIVRALLRAYRYPFKGGNGATVYARRDISFDLIEEKGTRLIFVDEAQNLVQQLGRSEHRETDPEPTVLLRELQDTTGVALVLAGTEKLDSLKEVDPALYDRVPTRQEFVHFSADVQWIGLLQAWLKACTAIDMTPISNQPDYMLMHKATGGSIRRMKRLLIEATLIAVDAGKQSLDRASVARAFTVISGADSQFPSPYAR